MGAVLVNVLAWRRFLPGGNGGALRVTPPPQPWALVSPVLIFAALAPLGWNPIYPALVTMLTGAALTSWCRLDLGRSSLLGREIVLVYYAVVLAGLELTALGYVQRVWNLDARSGLRLGFMPMEELLFAIVFGA